MITSKPNHPHNRKQRHPNVPAAAQGDGDGAGGQEARNAVKKDDRAPVGQPEIQEPMVTTAKTPTQSSTVEWSVRV